MWATGVSSTPHRLWSKHYHPDTGWGTTELVHESMTNIEEVFSPNSYNKLAIDANGSGFAVWSQKDDSSTFGAYSILTSRYIVGSGWGTAELIESNAETARFPVVAIDGNGNGLAVWHQADSDDQIPRYWSVWSNRYVAGSGWGTAEVIESNVELPLDPHLSLGVNGNGLVMWSSDTGLWSNHYEPGIGWGTPDLVEVNVMDFDIDVDASGNGIALMSKRDGDREFMWAKRYEIDSGWSTGEIINDEIDYRTFVNPHIAMNATGSLIAVWEQGSPDDNIWSNHYEPGIGWGTPEQLETRSGSVYDPWIAIDGNGNGLAVWSQKDDDPPYHQSIWANRYVVGSGW